MDELQVIAHQARHILRRFNLSGRNALVIGGTKGLGQAMALGLAGAGANVCVASRGPGGLRETEAAIASLGSKAASFAVDVTLESEVVHLVNTIESTFGAIDILVNSQGTVSLAPTAEFATETWQSVIDVNLKSVFLCCKYVGREMLKRKRGKIINVSSVRGFQGRSQDPAYAPSKGAVNQLTRSLAIEWAPQGINVNAIAPVFTLTEISKDFLDDKKNLDWVLSRIPMKRVGHLEDLLGPIVFLSSGASDFVHGHILPVDGGWLGA